MFFGQIALAFIAKRLARRCSLGILILAALLPDLLWTVFVLLGVERGRFGMGGPSLTSVEFLSWPVSHSLLMVIACGLAAAAIYGSRTKYHRGAVAVFALVIGHWILELLSRRSDLPIMPGLATQVGFGLNDAPAAIIALQAALFIAGIALYLDMTRPIQWIGRFGLVGMIGFASLLFLGTTSGVAAIGPGASLATSVATWTLVPWGGWVDRYRVVPRRF